MDSIYRDLRQALRMLSKNPGFSALALLVLALGIGANTAMFTLINGLLFRPLPVEAPDRLVTLHSKDTKNPNSFRGFSYPNFADLREKNTVFSGLFAQTMAMVGLAEGDTTRRGFATIVSSDYFNALGRKPVYGRYFTAAEEQPGSRIPVVIASYPYWKQRGGSPELVGASLRINGRLFTVIGIAPENFTGTTALFSPVVWLPMGMYEAAVNDFMGSDRRPLGDRDNHSLMLVGRLKPGITRAEADAQLAVLASQLEQSFPKENKDQTFLTHPLRRVGFSTNPSDNTELAAVSLLLGSMAAAVLLIACLNLANMMLARGMARRKEYAIRLALGGGRGRILRQILTEGLVLALLGGIGGLFLSYSGLRLLLSSMGRILPLMNIVFPAGPDPRVLVAMTGFCVLSTLLFGFGPALKVTRPSLQADLKESAGEDVSAKGRRGLLSTRNLLVVGQLSLSLLLLATAGLFIRGAVKASGINPGFGMENGLLVELDAGLAGYGQEQGSQTYGKIIERLRALPGVNSVSPAVTVPFGMVSLGRTVRKAGTGEPDGHERGSVSRTVGARFNSVGGDYFETLGVPVLHGRCFNRLESEGSAKAPVAVIDEALAQRLWPEGGAVGEYILFESGDAGTGSAALEVVGIVPTLRSDLMAAEQAHVYVPFGQHYQSNIYVHLRIDRLSEPAEASLMRSVRNEIRTVDEKLPILGLKSMRRHLEESAELWVLRTAAKMFSIFGLLALFLAVVGVYGVRSYSVARRTREIGIRMALGATDRDTLRLVLKEGLILTVVGVVLGVSLALVAGQLLGSMLYEVSSSDPLALSGASILLAAVSLAACYLPARRASRIDPMEALHYE